MDTPRYFYKYRSIGGEVELERTLDIMENHRIWFPSRDQLNDPFEGNPVDVSIRVLGSSIHAALEENQPMVEGWLNEFHILSLTSDGSNPMMWAHYANNYNGICFAFSGNGAFSAAERINYLSEKEPTPIMDIEPSLEEINELIRKRLLEKFCGWEYEEEWRIIRHESELRTENYFEFAAEDLKYIILGCNIKPDMAEALIKTANKANIDVLKLFVAPRTFRLYFLPVDCEIEYDGSPIQKYAIDLTGKEKVKL